MDILKNFGVDPVLMVAQIINFLIIFYLLKKFLYKPVMDMLKKREDKIQEGIKQAEESRQTLEKTLAEEKMILTKANTRAQEMLEEAKQKSLETSKEIEENARRQAESIIAQAKETIDQETKEVEQKLTKEISLVARDLLAKATENMFSEKEQSQIVKKTIGKIKH